MKFFLLINIFVVVIFFSGCQTIKKKSDEIVEKENAKLSQYIGKTSSELQANLGKADEDFKNEKGNFVLIYKTKKEKTVFCFRITTSCQIILDKVI